MKAPDKVYYTQTKYVANYFTIGKPFEGDCVEYIRKDALLEWANSLRENARKSRNNSPSIEFDRYMEGKEATLSKLIHKLNEM